MNAPRTPRLSTSFALLLFALSLSGCAPTLGSWTFSVLQTTPLRTNPAVGDIAPVHDPSMILQKGTYFLFTSDPLAPPAAQYLPIRCSTDKLTWNPCGQVFTKIPDWVTAAVPGVSVLWAPDISFFNGAYHLYYAGSTSGSQTSVIGLATNTTLNPTDPDYHWVDRGLVLGSHTGDDFNAIDPNILVDADQRVWLTYGSYWTGIKQREMDPRTGMLLASNATRYELARRPGTVDDAIEGASLVHHGTFYYLFLSGDHCCENQVAQDDYKQIVGRSTSPNGPFLDAQGSPLSQGGGSILIEGNTDWLAPGGGTAYLDPNTGESTLVFHALDAADGATPKLWVKTIQWQNDWPVLQ